MHHVIGLLSQKFFANMTDKSQAVKLKIKFLSGHDLNATNFLFLKGSRVQGSGFRTATGLKSGQYDRKETFGNLKNYKNANFSDFDCGSGFQPRLIPSGFMIFQQPGSHTQLARNKILGFIMFHKRVQPSADSAASG
jgi:hypothetical protein